MKLAIIALLLIIIPTVISVDNTVCIYFFYGETCPHCMQEKPFLEKMKEKYPNIEIHSFEVYFDKENQKLFESVAEFYNTTALGVPTTFIGNKVFVGFAEGDKEIFNSKDNSYVGYSEFIEKTIKEYSDTGAACPSFNSNQNGDQSNNTNKENSKPGKLFGYFIPIIFLLAIIAVLISIKLLGAKK